MSPILQQPVKCKYTVYIIYNILVNKHSFYRIKNLVIRFTENIAINKNNLTVVVPLNLQKFNYA